MTMPVPVWHWQIWMSQNVLLTAIKVYHLIFLPSNNVNLNILFQIQRNLGNLPTIFEPYNYSDISNLKKQINMLDIYLIFNSVADYTDKYVNSVSELKSNAFHYRFP